MDFARTEMKMRYLCLLLFGIKALAIPLELVLDPYRETDNLATD